MLRAGPRVCQATLTSGRTALFTLSECKAGEPDTKTFELDKTGSFEIEYEESGTHLGDLEVT